MQPYQPNQSVGSNNNSSNNISKSLSFQSFGKPPAVTNISNFQRSASREKLNQFTAMQQQHHNQFTQQQQQVPQNNAYHHHRNSLNSLMPFSSVQHQQFTNRRNSSCGTDRISMNSSMPSPLGSNEKILNEQGRNMSTSPNLMSLSSTTLTTTTTSDINSRLESLCRQMTEQAIN